MFLNSRSNVSIINSLQIEFSILGSQNKVVNNTVIKEKETRAGEVIKECYEQLVELAKRLC